MGFDHISKKFDKRANWVAKDPDFAADDDKKVEAPVRKTKAELQIEAAHTAQEWTAEHIAAFVKYENSLVNPQLLPQQAKSTPSIKVMLDSLKKSSQAPIGYPSHNKYPSYSEINVVARQQTEEQIIRQLYAENRHKWPAGRDEMVCVHWVGRPFHSLSAEDLNGVAGEVTHYVFTKRLAANCSSKISYFGAEIVCNGFMLDAKTFPGVMPVAATAAYDAWPAQP